LRVEPGDLLAVAAQQPHPDRGRRIKAPATGRARERLEPRAHPLCVGQPLDQLKRQLAQQRLGLGQQVLAALDKRAACRPPHRQKLGQLVGAGVVARSLERPGQQRVSERLARDPF
jgi:hypothetical protein